MKIQGITQKDILFLSLSFFVVVLAWIGFNLYHIWATSTIPEDLQKQIQPIKGTFDTNMINTLKTRQQIVPVYEIKGGQAATQEAILESEEATTEAELAVEEQ